MAMSDKLKEAGEQAKKAMGEHKTEAKGTAQKAQTKARKQVDEARQQHARKRAS